MDDPDAAEFTAYEQNMQLVTIDQGAVLQTSQAGQMVVLPATSTGLALTCGSDLSLVHVATPSFRFKQLDTDTDLNTAPSALQRQAHLESLMKTSRKQQQQMSLRLHGGHVELAGCGDEYGYEDFEALPPSFGTSSRSHASSSSSSTPTHDDMVHFLGPAENIKTLFKLPYSNSRVSLAIHRVGNTLIVDGEVDETDLPRGFDACNEVLQPDQPSQRTYLPSPPSHLYENFIYQSTQLITPPPSSSSSPPPLSSPVQHSQRPPHPPNPSSKRRKARAQLQKQADRQPDVVPATFGRTFSWTFHDMKMVLPLLGSDVQLFSNKDHPAVSLKLHDVNDELSLCTALDYYLDNVVSWLFRLLIWKYMMAMLCYRFASRAGRLVVAATASPTLQHRLRLRQRELLATCLELLDEIRTQPPQTSSCHHHPQHPSMSPKDSISAMVEEAMADTYLHGMLLATPHDAIEATASALPHLVRSIRVLEGCALHHTRQQQADPLSQDNDDDDNDGDDDDDNGDDVAEFMQEEVLRLKLKHCSACLHLATLYLDTNMHAKMLTSLADACMFMPVDAVPAHPRHVLLSVITSLDFFSTLATELDFGGAAASSTRSYKSSNGSSKQCQSMAHARACVLEVIGDAANVLDTNDTPTAAALFHAFAVVSGVLAETEASTGAESHYAHAVQLCFKAQAKLKSAKAGPPLHAKVNGELALTYLVWAVHLAKTQDNHLGVLEKFNKALNMYVELRDRRQVAATHYQMASYYSQQQVKTKQRMEAARRHYEKALEYFGGVEVGTTFVMIHKQLAELYASSTKMEDVEHALLVVLNTFDAFKRVATLPRHEQADLESMAPTLVLRLQEYLLQLIRLGSASTKPAMQATITRFKAMYRLTIDQNTRPFAQLLLALRNMYE
ncbi:hypothetical protein DYB34_002735 [Aphanomyces astaci]|uniref:EDRF1 N-terminal domain-containing protein n=1 Tax=Aphanomyces astaci TaxID=112090 RepID=A0A3R6ZNC7_APHAT|nr:hypothetical protein DYB34_002735 [Aphanomyces astaci]